MTWAYSTTAAYSFPRISPAIGKVPLIVFVRRLPQSPRMLSIGLHLRIFGRPGRIASLEQLLRHALQCPGVRLARREEIARACLAYTDGEC